MHAAEDKLYFDRRMHSFLAASEDEEKTPVWQADCAIRAIHRSCALGVWPSLRMRCRRRYRGSRGRRGRRRDDYLRSRGGKEDEVVGLAVDVEISIVAGCSSGSIGRYKRDKIRRENSTEDRMDGSRFF